MICNRHGRWDTGKHSVHHSTYDSAAKGWWSTLVSPRCWKYITKQTIIVYGHVNWHFCLSVRFPNFDPLWESSRPKDFNGRSDYTKHVKRPAHSKEVFHDFALQHSAFTASNFHTRSTDVSRAARLFGSLTDTWELGNVTFGNHVSDVHRGTNDSRVQPRWRSWSRWSPANCHRHEREKEAVGTRATQLPRLRVRVRASDSAEVQTETKLHNVTANARTRTTNARSEQRRKRNREGKKRETGGRRDDVVWVRTRARVQTKTSRTRAERKKGTRCYTCRRVEICVCRCTFVRVCVNGECVQRSVSSCRAWNGRERRAVSAPHPESPPETNPSYRDEPPTLNPCFAFPRPRFPLYLPLRSLSLALFPRRPVQPSVSLRAKPRRRKPNETGGKNAHHSRTKVRWMVKFCWPWNGLKPRYIFYIIIIDGISLLVSRFLEFIKTENLCRWNVL